MEHSLISTSGLMKLTKWSLNPYSNGTLSDRFLHTRLKSQKLS